MSDLELELDDQLRRTFYLGPLRAFPQRTYAWSGSEPSDMGRAGESAVSAILSALDQHRMISRGMGRPRLELEKFVALKLKEIGLLHSFSVEPFAPDVPIYTVRVQQTSKSPKVLLTEVGFGVSQILPVIVLCFYAPQGSTIILEQPEIHLHPAIQSGLADVLIDAVKLRGVQIIVESHSEHLLRRLQRRVADGTIQEKQVALYFCENDGLKSVANELQVDEFGNISN